MEPNFPVAPLPNPGEGGPVFPGPDPIPPAPEPAPDPGGVPVVPLPNPGEGGPAFDGNVPIIPLPNPGEGGPVFPGVIRPRTASVRFLNAAYGYRAFRIRVTGAGRINFLGYASLSAYGRVAAGYQTVTVSGLDGYVYLRQSVPFQAGSRMTLAVINRPGGLELLQMDDLCCAPSGRFSNFRVSNLAYGSLPMDVLLADGRTVYSDLRFRETAMYKRIRPGRYEFLFADTDQIPMPIYSDIETMDSAFLGTDPLPNLQASLYLNVQPYTNYTVFLLSASGQPGSVQAIAAEDR